MSLLAPFNGRVLNCSRESWEDVGDYNLILKSEMAYELGGGILPAVSGLCFTSNQSLVGGNQVLVYGPDLDSIKGDSPFGRVTILSVSQDGLGEDDKAYALMKQVEYTRYHVHPKGYMMRVSTASGREPVRVGKEALDNGLNFGKVGSLFLKEYRKYPEVVSAKVIFITAPDFPYDEFSRLVKRTQTITESLNHIFNDLQMDCGTCGFKPVCDEVEGLRELHIKSLSVK